MYCTACVDGQSDNERQSNRTDVPRHARKDRYASFTFSARAGVAGYVEWSETFARAGFECPRSHRACWLLAIDVKASLPPASVCDGVVATPKHSESGQTCVLVDMRDLNVAHFSNVSTAFPAALASGASATNTSDRQWPLLRRQLAHWRLVGVIVAALFNLATPTGSLAQGPATGSTVAPGPEPTATGPAAWANSRWWIVDRAQVDVGYTYDDNVTRSRSDDQILADQLLGLNVSAGGTVRINGNTRVLVTGTLSGEKFKTYN